ncbi:tRNA 2-selenouridine(34) synthase MnmH [Balneola sp. MJW-20]|uniref:tRNA 2-selenouridine(34) synthase MnmH n=1 Tax=Gracilimonas aurantiaca TaxID=3234185 RepID=UPI0034653506
MIHEIEISEALSLGLPIVDVRSPGEFKRGHIPDAVNIPLFSDEERAEVGTAYKQESREKALELGLNFVEPKLQSFIQKSEQSAPDRRVCVHCWRGGMRSESFAKHLHENDFMDVFRIKGGYKAYRRHVQSSFEESLNLNILGGYTGSGKTHILLEMKRNGEQVIDLEGMANHKGSAFGGIGQDEQPSTEHFENILFHEIRNSDPSRPIWVEDESINIGSVQIPQPFYRQMQDSLLYFLEIPKEERIKHLVEEYAGCKNERLADSIRRISKRLGGLRKKNALENLDQENYQQVASIALEYYDKLYAKGMNKRKDREVVIIKLSGTDHAANAKKIEQISGAYV